MQVFPLKCQMQKVMQQFCELATKFMYFETEKLKVERFHMLVTIFHKGTLSHGIERTGWKMARDRYTFISVQKEAWLLSPHRRDHTRDQEPISFSWVAKNLRWARISQTSGCFLSQTLMFMRSHLFITEL